MLHGSQKRFDKDGDGRLSMREWNRWYYYAVGAEEDARKRRAAYAALIEPYWVKIRLPEELEEESDVEEPDEDTGSEEAELQPDLPEQNGYYTFCMVQFQDGGAPYAYLTGGISLKAGDFVIVPVGKYDKERLGRVTDVFVCAAQDAPYPPEKTKFVLRKTEQTAFPAKKPAKRESQTAPMQATKKEPISTPPAVAKPKADTSKAAKTPVPAQPVAEKPEPEVPKIAPAPEPPTKKRRVPWGWLVAASAIAAFVIFPCRR